MPEGVALATTKRKFYKALDQFTTSSQTSLTPSSPDPGDSTKRPVTAAAAFDGARARATKRLRHSTSSSSLPQRIQAAPTPPRKDNEKAKEPPNFSPWSHETFLARLKTFSRVSLWHPKPDPINEVEWAKRGWSCVDVNTVACKGGCERRVVVGLGSQRKVSAKEKENVDGSGLEDGDENNDDEGDHAAFEQALVERYKDVIIEGHAPNCLWRKAGCKDDIYHVQVVRPSVWQPELRNRFQSVVAIASAVEHVRTKTVERDGSKLLSARRLIDDLPQDALGDHAITSAASITALDVALHGWRGSKDSGSELLNCDACFQRIGLWMYQPDYKSTTFREDDEDAGGAATIDLVEMHRDHCPWRNPTTQQASGSLKGLNACEILNRVISTYARDQRRRSDEQSTATNGHVDEQDTAGTTEGDILIQSRDEVARQDKERESRLRRIKTMFSIKRRSKSVPKAAVK